MPVRDGEDLDADVLRGFDPAEEFTGTCIAVKHLLDDADDKLVLAPEGKYSSPEQIPALTEFQECYFRSEILATTR